MAGGTTGTLVEGVPVEAPAAIANETVEYFAWYSRGPRSVSV